MSGSRHTTRCSSWRCKKVYRNAIDLKEDACDIIVDFAGFGQTTTDAVEAVRPGGTVVVGMGKLAAEIKTYSLITKEEKVFGSSGGTNEDLKGVYDCFARGPESGDKRMIVIRAYSPDDLDAVAELMGELGYPASSAQMRNRMEAISSDPMYATRVAELDGEVAGMAGLRLLYGYEYDHSVAQISALVTKAAYRGRGIGKELIRHAEKWAKERGAAAIVLTSVGQADGLPERRTSGA